MNEQEAELATRQLLAELREARDTREDAERRIAGLRKLVEGYIELFPLLDSLVDTGDLEEDEGQDGFPPRPRGMDAALAVLKERTGTWHTVPEVVDVLNRKGWGPRSSNPRNAVRAALERLVETNAIKKGKAKDTGNVVYAYTTVFRPVKKPETPAYDDFGEEPF